MAKVLRRCGFPRFEWRALLYDHPRISFVINCDTQDEVDHYWEKLAEGGRYDQCGWLTDQFGVSWQVVPTILGELMGSGNGKKSGAMMGALMQMKKLDIAGLKKAYDEG